MLDLVLTICDLYFKIVKSKIKKFSPAMMPGILADPLLKGEWGAKNRPRFSPSYAFFESY
jgi:hypothetical protein